MGLTVAYDGRVIPDGFWVVNCEGNHPKTSSGNFIVACPRFIAENATIPSYLKFLKYEGEKEAELAYFELLPPP